MNIFNTIKHLQEHIENRKIEKKKIGFVPTMGALHNGHLSLVSAAGKENDIVVVSIFVNPTQFNKQDDLKNYPRNISSDIKILENSTCDIVFIPEENEIYPDTGSMAKKYNFGKIVEIMEGKHRPGHFDGVATVVGRLFNIVKPNNAYFGQKDFQQLALIKELVNRHLTDLRINIHGCPIVREKDGLAMSSRNVRLNVDERKSAALISKTLFEAKKHFARYPVKILKEKITTEINADKNLKLEYIEIVTDTGLDEIKQWDVKQKMVACIAVQVGNVRLIDNVYIN
ncbi:MAG: pantoate--beta-alanine ligase [Bacteroidetes bacterium 4572_117]|nr:MAG: pantoate--beta-alanine ligase [Bacteroidetes bacterium 4572_117]